MGVLCGGIMAVRGRVCGCGQLLSRDFAPSGVEIWVKILDIFSLVKMGESWGNFCRFLWRSSRAHTYGMKTVGAPPAIFHL